MYSRQETETIETYHVTALPVRPHHVTETGVTTLTTAVVVRVRGAVRTQEAVDIGLAVTLTSTVVTVTGRACTVTMASCAGNSQWVG